VKATESKVTPLYVRLAGPLTRPFPNFDFSFIKSLRKRAVDLLSLRSGDRVLDVGCGSGASFPFLVDAVGKSGEVIGVEISPVFSLNARRRVEYNGWKNVKVIEDAAQTADLTGKFDGVLMMAAPDVYGSNDALDNIFPCLKRNARLCIFGAKTSKSRVGKMLSPVLKKVFVKFSFPTTPILDEAPWKLLLPRVDKLEIREYFFGLMFLASGVVREGKND
jgi:ubiquinone/menaquinone biosynthesis C-methylase UbiE